MNLSCNCLVIIERMVAVMYDLDGDNSSLTGVNIINQVYCDITVIASNGIVGFASKNLSNHYRMIIGWD